VSAHRLNRGEVVSALFALLLLIAMFALAWYGVDLLPGRPGSPTSAVVSENAWNGLAGVRWLMLITILVAFACVGIHAAGPPRQSVAALRLALLALSTVTAALVIVRVLIDLPSSDRVVDQKLGAIVGLLAALGMVYGAFQAVREQRSRLRLAAAAPT
jgi:hypothetical protein